MADGRPSDSMQPASKRRPGEQMTKDDVGDDDDDGPGYDPGEWRPNDPNAVKNRRKVVVRRGAGPSTPATPEAPAQATPAASSNPFAGISLAAPAAASSNPFANITLTPPAPQAAANTAKSEAFSGKADAGKETPQASTEAKQEEGAKENKKEDTKGDKPADSSNPFAGLSGASKPFGSGFSFGGTGGTSGFGALGASGKPFAGSGFGSETTGTGGSSFFNFSSNSFPPVKPLASVKEGAAGEEEGEEGEEPANNEGVELFTNSHVQPVVTLPEQKTTTGEEEERTVFTADGALYEFDSHTNQWRERGRGNYRVNVDPKAATARMVMRQTGNLRLLLNSKVYPSMPVQRMQGNGGLTFGVINSAAPSATESPSKEEAVENSAAKMSTWALRIKSSEKIAALESLLEKLKKGDKVEGGAEDNQSWV